MNKSINKNDKQAIATDHMLVLPAGIGGLIAYFLIHLFIALDPMSRSLLIRTVVDILTNILAS